MVIIQRSMCNLSTKHYVYILECRDHTLYTGYTNRLHDRITQHRLGKGAKYTRGRGPLVLRYAHMYDSKTDALKEEYRIKQLSKYQKNVLIKQGGNIDVDSEKL